MVGELLVVWCDKKLYGRVTCWLYGAVKESYAGQAPALVRLTKYEKKLHPAVRNNPFYHIQWGQSSRANMAGGYCERYKAKY